jgi:hypothetical protein
MSEATTLAADILSQFPNMRTAADGFTGSLAAVLADYPRQVAIKCANPRHGIARETQFLSIAAVVAWCERQTEPMRQDVSREQRVKAQLEARDEWDAQTIAEHLKANGKAWLDRTDPKARELVARMQADHDARVKAAMSNLKEANRVAFERECKAAGIDPAGGVSPTLRKLLGT